MVEIPDATALGAREPRASVPSINYGGSSPVANALQGLGATLGDLGAQMRAKENQQRDFDNKTRFLQWQNEWNRYEADQRQRVPPGASGFGARMDATFKERSEKFYSSLPEDQKAEYKLRFTDFRGDRALDNDKFERGEARRYDVQRAEDAQAPLIEQQRSNPAKWVDVEREGDALIDASPNMSNGDKAELKQKWRERRAEAHAQDHPDDFLSEMQAPGTGRVLSYANNGKIRNKPVVPSLEGQLQDAVSSVYGPGYTLKVISGGQDKKGHGTRRTGSVRHDEGHAADVHVFGPDGKQVSGDALAPLGQYWAAKKYGGVGMEMHGGAIHLDDWSSPPGGVGGMAWNYATKGGRYTPAMARAVKAGLAGQLPQLAAGASRASDAGSAAAVKAAAGALGISPVDLATVISYETGGTFAPSATGGKGGKHVGLIQFGPDEQAKYGIKPGQSFGEQMGGVVRYLKDRGLKPGMSLLDIYSTINAGRPGLADRSDGAGTVTSHVAQMSGAHRKKAEAFLGGEFAPPANAPPRMRDDGVIPPQYVGMSPERRRLLFDRLETDRRQTDNQSRVEQERAEREAEEAERRAREARRDYLDLQITTGNLTDKEVVLGDPSIDDGQKAVLLRSLQEKAKKVENRDAVLGALRAGTWIDPYASTSKKGLDELWSDGDDRRTAALMSGDATALSDLKSLYEKTQGMVPESANNALRGMLASGDKQKIIASLSAMDALYRNNPRAFEREFDDATTRAVIKYGADSAMKTTEEIVRPFIEALDPTKAKARQERLEVADKALKKVNIETVRSAMDTSWLPFSNPDAPVDAVQQQVLVNDYSGLVRDFFADGADEGKAQEMAAKKLALNWGQSVVNGGRLTRNPPEKYFPAVNGSHDWMREHLEAELVKMGQSIVAQRGAARATRAKPYMVMADTTTLNEISAGRSPTYAVLVQNNDGQYDLIPKRFDFSAAAQEATAKARAEFAPRHSRAVEAIGRVEKSGQEPGPSIGIGVPGAEMGGYAPPQVGDVVPGSASVPDGITYQDSTGRRFINRNGEPVRQPDGAPFDNPGMPEARP